ncbi:pectinesterase family protein [Niabella yanshanensis]|uniref:Pectinesterase n=1 Tax=Niabella yanshanensis TaxID=577386 RepID=A0ABZ0W2Y6_9BACT|nr:pectinesterase family protein [Niabella yanshanensis]WQD36385.1 pectinesterase family protein [Niabella yanshanensis]
MIRIFLLYLFAVCIANTAFAVKPDFIVAKDGTGNFTTVQEAIDAVPASNNKRTVIFIKNGTYKEKLTLPATKINVSFVGEDVNKVILTYDDYASKQNEKGVNIGTTGSSSFFIYGDGFTAENITFENSAGPVGQAVAVRVSADRIQFKNCRFLGFQDTLYVHGAGAKSRQYYKNCYIEGTTDFIFGAATVLFENCRIYCKKGGSYITAANTPKDAAYGMVFIKCAITGENGVSYYLGRPWGDFAKTVFIQSKLPAFIRPEGWHNWGRPSAEQTVHYAEFNNSGAGAATGKRVGWSKQLTKEDAKQYTAKHIFNGWNIGK